MTTLEAQKNLSHRPHGGLAASLRNAVDALVGNRQLIEEFSATAAHYDGLIDAIERAGWDVSRLEKVGHVLDETAQQMLRELTESLPEMAHHEQQSFLAPFHNAIHQFALMTTKEKQAFRREYSRFIDLHSRSLEAFAVRDTA